MDKNTNPDISQTQKELLKSMSEVEKVDLFTHKVMLNRDKDDTIYNKETLNRAIKSIEADIVSISWFLTKMNGRLGQVEFILRGWHRCLKHLCWRYGLKVFKTNDLSAQSAA